MGHSIKLKTFGANDEDTKFSSMFSLVCDFIHNAIIKMNMLLWLLYNLKKTKTNTTCICVFGVESAMAFEFFIML
jgi:hypothetical protein